MIFHISEDTKFLNSAIKQFNKLSNFENKFYVLIENYENRLQFVTECSNVFPITLTDLGELLIGINSDTILIFHALKKALYQTILEVNKKVHIIWMCHGFEVYNDPYFFDDKLSFYDITYSKYGKKPISIRERFNDFIRYNLNRFSNKVKISDHILKKKVFKRINSIGSPFKEEFENVKKLINFKGSFFQFTYYPIELIIDLSDSNFNNNNNNNNNVKSKKILVGNSAYYSSNHLDAFEVLKNSNVEIYKILVPLNYGREQYKNNLILEGTKLFGSEKFETIMDFKTISEYNNILNEIKIALIINRRQQAVGNTIALIYLGANVVLSQDNPIYPFFKRIGVIAHEFKTNMKIENLKMLSIDEINSNKQKIYDYFNETNALNLLNNQLLRL